MTSSYRAFVISNLQEPTIRKYANVIDYFPGLGDNNINEFDKVLHKYKPRIIIFGTNVMDAAKLSIWRDAVPKSDLYLLRRGVTIARCDLNAAERLNINVLNTPGSNATFITDFIINNATNNTIPESVTIIGLGNIGKIVAQKLRMLGVKKFYFFSRRFKDLLTRNDVLNELKLHNHEVHFINNLIEGFKNSECIIVTLPFNQETQGLIKSEYIDALQNGSQFISTSFPDILTKDAIITLYKRNDLHVVFDHLKTELSKIYDLLNIEKLRENFIMDEQAAASYECQCVMDEAVMNLFLKIKEALVT